MVATAEAAVEQAQAVARRAAAAYVKWESEHGRFVQLAANGSVTEKLVDESREQLAAADANRQEAQAKQASARAGVAESKAGVAKAAADLVAAEARLRVAQAEHAKAVTLLQYGTIEAPFDGVVTRRNVHTGHLVHAGPEGEPLLVLMRTDVLRVAADVPEADADLIRPGQPVSIRLPALAGEPLAGKVARTSGSLDVATRTLRVEIDVPNQDGKLQPGLYAYVSIVAGEHPDALVLPASAILSDKNQSECVCVENGKIVRKPVTLGLRTSSEVEIASGLKGDEAVVRVNSGAWTEGQTVEAKPAAPVAP
jgi:RND family efflux transporter MFP subunit